MCKSNSANEYRANRQNNVVETSSGTHFIELHFPSMGMGLGFLVIGALLLLMAFWCLRKVKRSNEGRGRRNRRQIRDPYEYETPSYTLPMAQISAAMLQQQLGAYSAQQNPMLQQANWMTPRGLPYYGREELRFDRGRFEEIADDRRDRRGNNNNNRNNGGNNRDNGNNDNELGRLIDQERRGRPEA